MALPIAVHDFGAHLRCPANSHDSREVVAVGSPVEEKCECTARDSKGGEEYGQAVSDPECRSGIDVNVVVSLEGDIRKTRWSKWRGVIRSIGKQLSAFAL